MLVSVSTVPTEVSIVDTEGDLFDVGDCDAAMFVFSTISRRSFDDIKGLTDRITQLHRSGCLLALVGTKTDLDPQQVSPGTAMPNLNVGAGDARDITAFLYTRAK